MDELGQLDEDEGVLHLVDVRVLLVLDLPVQVQGARGHRPLLLEGVFGGLRLLLPELLELFG